MTARIIDLAIWRRDHPPLLRCWSAYWRCAEAWTGLWTRLICSAIPGRSRNDAALTHADSAQ